LARKTNWIVMLLKSMVCDRAYPLMFRNERSDPMCIPLGVIVLGIRKIVGGHQVRHNWSDPRCLFLICCVITILIFASALHAEEETAPGWILKGIEKYNKTTETDHIERAIECFEKAYTLEPKYIPGLVWLGIAYVESGKNFTQERYKKAEKCFQDAVSLPDPEKRFDRYKTKAKERLKELPDKEPVKCQYCADIVAKSALNDHVKAKHTFPCKYCDTVCHAENELNDHIKAKHTWPCKYCDIVFHTESELNDHVKAKHTFKCNQCALEFHTQDELDRHIVDTHGL